MAGNFSAFWTGLCILSLMFAAYYFSGHAAVQAMMPPAFQFAAPIFAFGLVAFGFLGMGPVTIAVDSFGPVTDNAQSVYELSQIEAKPGIAAEIEQEFGFKPDFESAKHQLEKGDGAGNTFKATAKPVLDRHGGRRRHHDGFRHHHDAAGACSRTRSSGFRSFIPKHSWACSWAAR